ncbi:MAG: hypothetical protein ACO4BJ_00545 [Planctomycetota bacterium]|jgi:hypothetical protein
MALFIVLILVLILTIVIFQLTYTTKIEERISRNRDGFQEITYSLQGFARSAIQLLEQDLMEDLGLFEEEAEEDTGNFGDFGSNNGPPQQVNPNTGEAETERYDLRHETWAVEIEDQMNDVEATVWIRDGEGRISLNHLFDYPQYEEEALEDLPGGIDIPPIAAGSEDEEEDEEEEWEPPTVEQLEDAELILSRMIQMIIAENEQNTFDYVVTPDPDEAASAIVEYVAARMENENTRLLRSLEPIRGLPEVGYELFDGPQPTPEELLEELDEEFEGEFSNAGLFEELESSQIPGYEMFEDGVRGIPRRLGLRDFLTVHSSGKINLNTVAKPVLVGLLLSFESFDEAVEIATAIEEHLNSYKEEDEEDLSGQTPSPAEGEEEETEEFEKFTKFDDLASVDETWTEGEASEDSIMDLLRFDLAELSVFKSTYFDIQIEGEREGRKLAATMGVARLVDQIIVLSWEESPR